MGGDPMGVSKDDVAVRFHGQIHSRITDMRSCEAGDER